MALQKTTLDQNVAAISVFVVLVCAFVSYLWLLPNRQTNQSALNQAQAQKAGLQKDKSNLDSAQNRLDQAKQALSDSGVDITKAQAAMPAFEDVPGLYIEMESIAAKASAAGYTDASYTLGTPTSDTASKIAKVPVTFQAKGTYLSLKALVATLESSLRPMVIEQVSFATATDGKYAMTLAGSFWASALSPAYATTTTSK